MIDLGADIFATNASGEEILKSLNKLKIANPRKYNCVSNIIEKKLAELQYSPWSYCSNNIAQATKLKIMLHDSQLVKTVYVEHIENKLEHIQNLAVNCHFDVGLRPSSCLIFIKWKQMITNNF